jgi:L-2-hydroxyglutarate oxidase LhgO
MEKADIAIAGAGVVGLSIAAELSQDHKDIFVLEQCHTFGQEISSRNSEVIHAGIYYPKDSLKTKTCIEGRRMLYEFCARNNIPHKKTGKLIVAVNEREVNDLEMLFKHGLDNGVEDLRFIPKSEIKDFEPLISAEAAIYSPSTGILDTHSFMKTLVSQFESRGGSVAYGTELTGIEKNKEGFIVRVQDSRKNAFKFLSRIFINCAGLNSDKVSSMAGLAKDEYKLKYCKGDYFRVSSAKARFINRLVYPVPKKEGAGLGVHATPDLAGSLRLGPDDEYIKEINYDINPLKAQAFYESTRQFLPFIEMKDLNPDMSGVRPKLQGPGEDFRDFIIKDEGENGLEGFINLIGIESPGLTASLSIAKMVSGMVSQNG